MLSAPSQASAYGFAVVDVEATGSSSRRHRVVELAVVLLDKDLAPQGEFATLVDPHGPVGPTHIHGIEGGDLGGAPSFEGIAARLLNLLRGRVLVGHNVGCDRSFLAAEYARLGVRLPSIPELCTMRMAAARLPVPHGLSLRDCAAAAGVTQWHAHTALGDALATAELFSHYVRGAESVEFAESAVLDERLALAAAVEWPQATGLTGVVDALWKRRSNDSARRMVPNVRNGSA
ncbi:3'-5' exonuclease [Streptomyces sp. CBMA29]|uniref:3'-5' exonuclease n=1 Tax=Streptomyces sp. CBMA29 TaxID=1896314 RepID=UPI002948C4A1|nr:3'-5' exonuclease [Streptomyces sp. CBMA29]